MLMCHADTGGTPEPTERFLRLAQRGCRAASGTVRISGQILSGSSPEAGVPGTRLESGETEGAWGN